MKEIITLCNLLALVLAAEQEPVFRVFSSGNQIMYSQIKENEKEQLEFVSEIQILVDNLMDPTYLEFDFENSKLYFCDRGQQAIQVVDVTITDTALSSPSAPKGRGLKHQVH